MAKHLLAKGHTVVVCNRSQRAVDELVALGAVAATSPAEVARQVTVVITMLPDTPDVERVLTGPDGVLMVGSQFAPLSERILAAIKQISGGRCAI